MKRKPTGFVALCQCSKIVGALDFNRTPRSDAGEILGHWLQDGCTVMPHFTANWSATIEACQCDALSKATATNAEYQGVRCMCIGTGCRAGPGCPHYTTHCKKHINHASQQGTTP